MGCPLHGITVMKFIKKKMRLFLNWVYRERPSVHHSVANLARIDRLMATVMKRGALLFCFSASIASACAHNEARIKMCNAADRRNKIESI